MEVNEFIYPYSNQYINRLNSIASHRQKVLQSQKNDVINTRAYSSFIVPAKTDKNEERGRRFITKKRSDSPSIVVKNEKNSITNANANAKRSNSVDNLKRQRTPKQALMNPVRQHPSSVFDEHRSRSRERTVEPSLSQTRQDIQSTSVQYMDPNRYNSPTSSRPVLNRVRDNEIENANGNANGNGNENENGNRTKSSSRREGDVTRVKRNMSTPRGERGESLNEKHQPNKQTEKSKDFQARSKSPPSIKGQIPSVPPRSAFARTYTSKPVKDEEKIFVLPVQYSFPSPSTSSFSALQHGVIVLNSSVTLCELAARLQEQFDLPEEFDIILSQRNIEEKHRSQHTSPAMIQMFPRVNKKLISSMNSSIPGPILTDQTVIQLTPSTTTHIPSPSTRSTHSSIVPSSSSSTPAPTAPLSSSQRLPVDGIDSLYRRQLLRTPKTQTHQHKLTQNLTNNHNLPSKDPKIPTPENGHPVFNEVTSDSTPLPFENILLQSTQLPSPSLEGTSPASKGSSKNKSSKSIFSYTEIDNEREDANEEESVSVTIDGTIESAENVEFEDDLDNENTHHLDDTQQQQQQEKSDTFKSRDFLVNQLFYERKLQKNDIIPSSSSSTSLLSVGNGAIITAAAPTAPYMAPSAALSTAPSAAPSAALSTAPSAANSAANSAAVPMTNSSSVSAPVTASGLLDSERFNLLNLKISPDDSIKKARNGIYSYHPPQHSFRKLIKHHSTPLSSPLPPPPPPPPPPSSPPLETFPPSTESTLMTPRTPLNHEENHEEDLPLPPEDNFSWHEPLENSPRSLPPPLSLPFSSSSSSSPSPSSSSKGLRTTPTSIKSLQFRQYYENLIHERKLKNSHHSKI